MTSLGISEGYNTLSHTAASIIDHGSDNFQATADAVLSFVTSWASCVRCAGLQAPPGKVKARPEASQVPALVPGPVESRHLRTEYPLVSGTFLVLIS